MELFLTSMLSTVHREAQVLLPGGEMATATSSQIFSNRTVERGKIGHQG